jgi:hypothetical protein
MRKVPHEICRINTEGESASGDSAATEQFPETLCKVTEDGEYTDE